MSTFNKIIHERARLLIISHLASSDEPVVSFSELQERLELTPGNLSVQLRKLKAAGYVKIKKVFKDNKPLTTVSMTPVGKQALNDYVEEMEKIIRQLKN